MPRARPDPALTPEVVDLLRALLRELASLRQALPDLAALRDAVARRQKPFFSVEEVAKTVSRAPYTVRAWIAGGRLKAIRVQGAGPRGRLLVPRDELDRLVASGGLDPAPGQPPEADGRGADDSRPRG